MVVDAGGKRIEIEPNSKPYLAKQIIADGFDALVLFGLFMILVALILKTPLASVYEQHYERIQAIEEETKTAWGNDTQAVARELGSNAEYRDERFAASLHSYLLKVLAAFLAEIVLLLTVPLCTRYRQTPGKLMTGIMPYSKSKQTKARWYQIVYRFLFVFLIDSLGLYLFTGIWTFVLVLVLRLVERLLSKNDRTLCDLVTGVTVIEKLSYRGLNS